MAGVATHPLEAMLRSAAFQAVLEFLLGVLRLFRALRSQLGHEFRIVLFYQLIEQRLLRTVGVSKLPIRVDRQEV